MFEPGGTTASDAEPQTVEAFLARRPSGLDDVYRLYGSRLYAVARDVLGNVEDAQDCVHDALLRIWQRPPVYRPERGALRAYLVVAIRNDAISRKRATMRHLVIEERAAKTDSPGYEVELQDHVELQRLRAAVDALPPEQRAALRLAYYGHLSQSQIAERLGVPLGTVKSRVAMALRKLQTAIGVGSDAGDARTGTP